ncbi:MAG: hypothetical protein IT212_07520 [Bacteroidia bacterium]|nr:hypothetical protein [Bacteroidia bacterium]
MIDLTHIPDNKTGILIKPILIILSSFELTVYGFFGDLITWMAKIFAIVFTGMWIYDYLISDYRYRQWAKNGFKPEEKDKYRIK